MMIHVMLAIAMVADPICRGTQCASGVCVPPGTACPSATEIAVEAGQLPQPAAPAVSAEEAAVAREEAELKAQARRDRLARAPQSADEAAFERAVYFNKLGFGLGVGAAFSIAIGVFTGAWLAQRAWNTCEDLGACPEQRAPGFALNIGVGTGFAVAGLAFTILAANSRARIARRSGRIAISGGGVTLRF